MVRAILFQVGSGLAYAHRRGVIHRDVKPANILLDRDGNAIVTDFGIAKVAEAPGQTQTGTMVGTPAYMSPEQCVAEAVTWASDQYSLGIVAYELLTGAPPFSGSSYATMQGHLERAPEPIRTRRPDCPAELEAGVLRMLAKDPADRFPTMAEALQAIGARPLGVDDPLRGELAALIGPPTGAIEAFRVPRSPAPASRAPASPAPTTPTPRAARVTLSGAHDALEPGDRLTLDLSVSDAAGQPVPDRPAAWSSSDPAIATVDRGGLVQALAAGTASITARVDEAADSVTVHVRPPAVAAISLEAPRELTAGRQASAKAKLLDRARRPLEDRGVEWSSSDDAIASVDARGAITAHRPGSVTLTASADGQDASTTLRVTAPVAASVTFAEEIDSVEVGEECQLRATVRDADGSLLERTIAWRSSNARVATVSDEGLVRALAPGRSRITATVDRAVGTTRIAVAAPPPPPPPAWWPSPPGPGARGSSLRSCCCLASRGCCCCASRRRPRRSCRSATRSRPPVRHRPRGGTQRRAAAPASRPRLIARPTVITLTVNESAQLRAGLIDSANNAVDGPAPHWSSTDRGIVMVDADGKITGVAPGSATVTATALGRRAPVTVTVRAPRSAASPRAATIALTLPRPLQEGDTTTLRATVRDSAGRRLDDDPVVWSSADPEIAGVDGTSGLVRAMKEGRTTISATVDGRTQRVPLMVSARPAVSRPPAAPPAATPAAGAGASVGETAIRSAASACFAALRAGDAARVQQLYQPESERDRKNEEKLLTLMRRKEWAFLVTTTEITVTPVLAEDRGSGTFSAHLSWKNSFGQRREETVAFRTEARRGADGTWNAAGCRLEGTPGF